MVMTVFLRKRMKEKKRLATVETKKKSHWKKESKQDSEKKIDKKTKKKLGNNEGEQKKNQTNIEPILILLP